MTIASLVAVTAGTRAISRYTLVTSHTAMQLSALAVQLRES